MRRGVMQCIIKIHVSCREGKASQKVWQWLNRQWTRVLPRIKNYSGSSRNSSQVMYGIRQDHWNLYQKEYSARDDNQVEELRNLRENVRQVTKMTGK
jgi:hypothetical protein